MAKWFTIKYVDYEVEVTEDELKKIYAAWNNGLIYVRKDMSTLGKGYLHILPSQQVHYDGSGLKKLAAPQLEEHKPTDEEIKKKEEIYKKTKEKLWGKNGSKNISNLTKPKKK